jgi:anti-sigma factor RsiW
MMNWTDDTLMAYADGELADPPRGEFERALAADATLRARVEAMQAQRARLGAAFAPVLDEPMPQRLLDLLQPAGAATASAPAVANLDARRAAREQANAAATEQARQRAAATPRTAAASWARWGGMAAALLLGVMLGTQLDRGGPGIGLRDGAQWGVQTLAAADSASQPIGMRQAASALPRAVLDAVDAQIAGPALDAAGERAARDAGWRR